MSSLTTISSGMEDSVEVQHLVDTRLCLSLSLATGAVSRPPPPVPALLPASPPPGAAAGTKRKEPESGTVGSTATTRRHDKRARMVQGDSTADDDGGEAAGGGARKKLRLTGEQAALLEKSFRAHSVLSHGEKNDLARQLGLKARQVEVWFQNRRARTKLKQTELDCELLRRWCQRLSHDNERLRLELAEARSSSSSAYLSRITAAPAPVHSACPSCKELSGGQVWT